MTTDAPSPKILVTGAGGFIAKHLVPMLRSERRHLVLASRTRPEVARSGDDDQTRWLHVDLCEAGAVEKLFCAERPAVVLHLAGSRCRRPVPERFSDCIAINVLATTRVLEAAARWGAQRVVMLGSAEEYGPQPGPHRENLAMLPQTAYGISKAAATRLATTMHDQAGVPVVVLRPYSVYGPGQPLDMFVAEAVDCAVRGRSFRMTRGEQRRDLVYVEDVVGAIVAAATVPDVEGRVFNVGSGTAHRLLDVAGLIWRLADARGELLVGAREPGPGELIDTWADVSAARSTLRWMPRVDLEQGLARTIAAARTALARGESVCAS